MPHMRRRHIHALPSVFYVDAGKRIPKQCGEGSEAAQHPYDVRRQARARIYQHPHEY
jgi:hypothetical protein